MFTDLIGPIKDGVILHLSSNRRLTQFLPPERIFGLQVPSNPRYPYLRVGTPITTPYVASCFTGTSVRMTLNVFAQGHPGAEAGETQATRITRLLVEAMDSLRLENGYPLMGNEFLGNRISMVDQEADRWMTITEFNITAVISAP